MKRAAALQPLSREHLGAGRGEGSLEQVRALGALLHDHVRFEERELFPAVEAALDAGILVPYGDEAMLFRLGTGRK